MTDNGNLWDHYQLPSGVIVSCDATATKSEEQIDYTLANGQIVKARLLHSPCEYLDMLMVDKLRRWASNSAHEEDYRTADQLEEIAAAIETVIVTSPRTIERESCER